MFNLKTLRGVLLLALLFLSTQSTSASFQTYSISGRVVDGLGNGIRSATVVLGGTQNGTMTTDSNGSYTFSGLAEGSYTLSPSKLGQYNGFARVVQNLSGNLTADLRLDPYIVVNVSVVDSSGTGLAGVLIRINDQSFGSPLTNSFGNANLSLAVSETGVTSISLTPQKPGFVFNPTSVTLNSQNGNQSAHFTAAPSSSLPTYVQFSAPSYTVNEEAGVAEVTVTRTGDVSLASSVFYFTADAGVATQTRDYTMAGGVLNFGPGETNKTINVLITDNTYIQGTHTLFLQIGSPTGGTFLGTRSFVTLSIIDNDNVPASTNPLEEARFFVRQHYADFLNRLPDQGGLDYWAEQMTACGSDPACLTQRRIGVSAAFFVELEFQKTGFVIYRLNRAALGMIPSYTHFMIERGKLTGGLSFDENAAAYSRDFVQGGAFRQFYPESLSPADFVNRLFLTAGLTDPNFDARRQSAILDLSEGRKTRAQILMDVIEIPEFRTREYNPAFVLMQYYGYLRRDPDPGGYEFWLSILNNNLPNDSTGYRSMVCAFITSGEYQERFSPVRTRADSECAQH